MSAIKETRRDRVFNGVVITIMLAIVFLMVYPLYFTIIASVSDPNAVFSGKVLLYPSGFTWDSYTNIFKYKQLWTGYRNSIFYTVCTVIWQLFLMLPAAYALTKKELKGKTFFLIYMLIPMYIGGGMIPYYLQIKQMGLINTPWVMIFPAGVGLSTLVVVRTFFQVNIPDSLIEAAKIDGAGEFRIFFRIVIPLSGAIIAVQTLFMAVGSWNSFMSALLYINDKKLYPLQLVLRNILVLNQTPNIELSMTDVSPEDLLYQAKRAYMAEAMKFSIIFVASAPMLIAYPFVQKYFVKGVLIGSVKG